MNNRTELNAIVQEHRRLREAAQQCWHKSPPGTKLSEVMAEHMGAFWREHPEWRPFNVPASDEAPLFVETSTFLFRAPPLIEAHKPGKTVTLSARASGKSRTPDDVVVQ